MVSKTRSPCRLAAGYDILAGLMRKAPVLAAFGALLGLVLLVACHSAQPEAPAARNSSDRHHETTGPRRDLSQDEEAGGHTLKKHVGRTDDQLRERLRHERNISAASTYTDRDAAESAVGAALASNSAKVQHWLDRAGGHPNLVLDYDGDHPIGRTLRRGDDQTQPCSHAVVVLKWNGDAQFYVLTSYPEC